MLDVARSRRPSRRSSTGRYYTPPPPPKTRTPPQPPPTPPPPNQRANKRFSRQTWKTSQGCAHVGRNVGQRSHPLQRSNHDMERDTYTARTTASIWAQKKGKRTLINLSETFGGSGNPRAGGSYDICNAEVGMKICNAEGLQGTAQGSITGPILARPNWQKWEEHKNSWCIFATLLPAVQAKAAKAAKAPFHIGVAS